MSSIRRKEFVRQLASLGLSSPLRPFAAGQSARPKTRLILLGTAGGPRPRKTRVPSSLVVLANDAAYAFGRFRQTGYHQLSYCGPRAAFVFWNNTTNGFGLLSVQKNE